MNTLMLMSRPRLTSSFFVFLPLLATAVAAHAQVTLPSSAALGLNPGDTYQFVFVTSGTTTASTSGSSYYNNFVQTAANSAGIGTTAGLTWNAMVSTGTQGSPVRANTNAPVSATAKVFLLNGTMVANGGTVPFYSSADHLAAINYSELGTTVNRNVWTGSNATGSESGSGLVGNASSPVAGYSGGTIASNGDPNSWARNTNFSASNQYSLYGVSSVLTATSAAPEPGSLALLAVGVFGGVGMARRRARRSV